MDKASTEMGSPGGGR